MAAWTAAATLAGCLNNLWLRRLAESGFSGRAAQSRKRSASVGTVSREDRSPDARGSPPSFENSASPLPQRSYAQRCIFRPPARAGCRQGSRAHAERNDLAEEMIWGRNGLDKCLRSEIQHHLLFFRARWLSYANGIFLTIEPGDSFWVYTLGVLLDHPLFPNN
jgi:hypothetical protein